MIISGRREGQTLIETALVLFLLLLILLGITEFARAWYTKSSLKNAVRQGARVAAVTPAANIIVDSFDCINPTCPILTNTIQNAVCCQPGIPRNFQDNTQVTLECRNSSGGVVSPCNLIPPGGSIKVSATSTFGYIIGNSPWPWPKSVTITTDASMRYE